MIDLAPISAGFDFDKLIAEELGYSDFEISALTGVLWGWRKATSEDHATFVIDGKTQDALLNWSEDLNAAFVLPLEDLWFIDLHGYSAEAAGDGPGEYNAWIRWSYGPSCEEDDPDHPSTHAAANEPALAVCRAWLLHKAPRRFTLTMPEGEVK